MKVQWRVVFQVAVAVALFGFLTASRGAEPGLTLEQLVQLRRVSGVAMQPNGNHVAYQLLVTRPIYTKENGPAWVELHVADLQGASRPFVTGQVNVDHVAWHPDGTAISFLAKRGEDKHAALYVIPLAGGEARKILEHKTAITDYDWSPDGRKIAFLAQEEQPEDRKEAVEHGFNAEVYEENWRLTRVWIATPDLTAPTGATKLKKETKPDDKDEKRSEPRKLELEGSALDVRWNPNGSTLAVITAPTPSVDDIFMKSQILFVEADSGKVLGRVNTEGKLGPIAWNSSGKRLALIGADDEHDPYPGQLMVVSGEGGDPKRLLPEYPGHVSDIAWQNEDTILYVAGQGVWTLVETIRHDGTNKRTLVQAEGPILSDLSTAKNGLPAAFVGSTPDHPPEVFALADADSAPRRLTHSNPSLQKVALAKQQLVRYPAADGLELEGLLIRPLNAEPGKRYPLIMMVHGGPESHWRNGWISSYGYPGQVAAASGFAAFYPNYRGSTGRGLEFAKSSQADPAGKEFTDLLDAIEFLAKEGLVDTNRVGITGISYGGYASAWGATAHSKHYAAAVMGFGISDLLYSFALSDIPEELTKVHLLKYPWEAAELYRERSPLEHFQDARTPILIIHGTADTRVHPAHAFALYRMLKTYGKVPVRLVLQPDEPHGSRRIASQVDYGLRLLRWMKHYLQDDQEQPPPPELDLERFKDDPKKD